MSLIGKCEIPLCYWKATKWRMCALFVCVSVRAGVCVCAPVRVCVGDTTFVQMPQIPPELG